MQTQFAFHIEHSEGSPEAKLLQKSVAWDSPHPPCEMQLLSVPVGKHCMLNMLNFEWDKDAKQHPRHTCSQSHFCDKFLCKNLPLSFVKLSVGEKSGKPLSCLVRLQLAVTVSGQFLSQPCCASQWLVQTTLAAKAAGLAPITRHASSLQGTSGALPHSTAEQKSMIAGRTSARRSRQQSPAASERGSTETAQEQR
jgi:hypothetical protein